MREGFACRDVYSIIQKKYAKMTFVTYEITKTIDQLQRYGQAPETVLSEKLIEVTTCLEKSKPGFVFQAPDVECRFYTPLLL